MVSTGRSRASFASAAAVSKVPPIPTPRITGGQGLPPAMSIVSTTNLGISFACEGRSIPIRETFSEPAPFGSTVTSNRTPGVTWTAGISSPVLSPEFFRVSGSTTLGRSGMLAVARRTPSRTASLRAGVNGTSGGRVR
ncbi:hypothetical protein DSECCO2_599420 [anaerobic digester metagenome]